jgi:hypothetical protein
MLKACAAGPRSPREATDVMGLISTRFLTLKVIELVGSPWKGDRERLE